MVLKALLSLAISIISIRAHAQAECDFSQSKLTVAAVLSCAETRVPEVQRAALEYERSKSQVKQSSQRLNPELSLETFGNSSSSLEPTETEVSLGFPIELGGKRGARVGLAEAEMLFAKANLESARMKARATTLLKLHRFRQLLHEKDVIEESIATFNKLVAQYSSRLSLSPEQSMSVAVFRMSKSEYELRKLEILEEIASIDSFFKVSLGFSSDALKSSLPQSPKVWPKLEVKANSTNSPRLQLIQADLTKALAEQNLTLSETWPTLVIGPSLKIQSGSGQSEQVFGLNLSFPIPISNLSGANRELAAAGASLAEANKRYALQENDKFRDEQIRVYEQSVSILNTSLSHVEIEKKHVEIERLFLRGVVPSSLVIEAHRTFVELEHLRNERELRAIEAFLLVHELDGKTPELL